MLDSIVLGVPCIATHFSHLIQLQIHLVFWRHWKKNADFRFICLVSVDNLYQYRCCHPRSGTGTGTEEKSRWKMCIIATYGSRRTNKNRISNYFQFACDAIWMSELSPMTSGKCCWINWLFVVHTYGVYVTSLGHVVVRFIFLLPPM